MKLTPPANTVCVQFCMCVETVLLILVLLDCSLLELYLRGRGGQELRGAIVRSVTSRSGRSSVWSELLPQSVTILLAQLYPLLRTVIQYFLSCGFPEAIHLGGPPATLCQCVSSFSLLANTHICR